MTSTSKASMATAVTENEPARVAPFFKWVGGKRQLLPELRKHVPTFKRYFEPFVGGGALFFDLGPREAFLADQNSRLMMTYQAVRDRVDEVIALLRTYPHTKDFYLELRSRDIDDARKYSAVEVAAWFLYLNKTGFNGLYRVNQSGGFNVPFGQYNYPMICDEGALRAASKTLQGVHLDAGDFEQATVGALAGDFVYFDPPYVPASATGDFTTYTPTGFGMEEQVRLRDHARALVAKGVRVVLSNSDTSAVRDLYGAKPFRLHEVQAKRSINSKTKNRGKVGELIITTKGRSQ